MQFGFWKPKRRAAILTPALMAAADTNRMYFDTIRTDNKWKLYLINYLSFYWGFYAKKANKYLLPIRKKGENFHLSSQILNWRNRAFSNTARKFHLTRLFLGDIWYFSSILYCFSLFWCYLRTHIHITNCTNFGTEAGGSRIWFYCDFHHGLW